MKESASQFFYQGLKMQQSEDESKDKDGMNSQFNNDQNISLDSPQRCFYQKSRLHQSLTSVTKSPYFQKYEKQFRKGRKPPHFSNYNLNFLRYDITCLTQINFFEIQMIYHSRNYRIVHYKVRLSYFGFIIKILNISNQDNFIVGFVNEINKGMFGTVYQIKTFDRSSAVKELLLEKTPIITIKKAIYEYSLMKIMAALECGPKLDMIFGFDIVVTQKSLYFSAQKCLHVQDYVQFLDNEKFQSQFQKLQMSLLQMHSLNICHNDIKPSNVLYSPSLNRLVFIDFGFSQIKTISLGQMQNVKAKGSFYYSCDDMKNAFTSATGFGLVDTYYNDYYAIKKTKEILQSSLSYQYQSLSNQFFNLNQQYQKNSSFYSNMSNHISYLFEPKQVFQQLSLNCQRQCSEKTFDYLVIFFCFLIVQNKFQELQKLLYQMKQNLKIINSKFLNIYWIFIEIDYNKQIHRSYTKLKQILVKQDIVSFETKNIIQNILDPYFIQTCNQNCQQNLYLTLYMNKQNKIKQDLGQIYKQQNPHLNIYGSAAMNISQTNRNYYQKHLIYIGFQQELENYKQYRFDIGKISEQEINLVCDVFNLQDEIKMSIVFSSIEIQIHQLQSINTDAVKVIRSLKSIFEKFNIHVTNHPSGHKIFSILQQSEMWLDFIIELLTCLIKRFNLKIAILNLLKFQENRKYLKETIDFFKRKEQSENLKKILKEFDNNFQLKSQSSSQNSVKIFQQALIIWIKIFRTYITNLPYNQSMKKRDSFIRTLTQKILQVIEYKYEFEKSISSPKMNHVLNSLLQMQYLFIYQVGLNSYLKAEAKGDYKKIVFYFNYLFNHQPYQKFITSCKHDLQYITNNNLIFYFSKDLCQLIVYKTVLPERLSQKYKFSVEIQKLIQGVVRKANMNQNFHINQIKNLLLLQHYFALSNQFQYIAAVKLFQKIVVFSQSDQSQDFYYSFYLLWKQLNNNKKIKSMKKNIHEHSLKQHSSNFCFSKQKPLDLSLDQTKNASKLIEFQNDRSNKNHKNLCKLKMISFDKDVSLINLPNAQHKDLLRKKFIQLMKTEHYDIELRNKLLCIRRIIEDELNAYPNQQRNLQLYLENYKRLIRFFEEQIVDNLKIMRQLNICVPIYDFITDCFNKSCLQSDLRNKITENQFWQELKREWIMSEYLKIMYLLLKNQHKINRKQLIFDMWILTKQKISQLFNEQQFPAYVWELQSQVYQCEYHQKFQIYKRNQSSQSQIIANQHYKKFIMSTKKYLTYMDSIVHLSPHYILEMKGNIFYPITLIKIFNKQITIQGFAPTKAKQIFINYCQYLIKEKQYYQIFKKGQVFQSILNNVIVIGCDQVWKFINQLQDSPRKHFFLSDFLKVVGKFYQCYPCSNYTKTFLLIAESIIIQIQKIFSLNLDTQCKFSIAKKKSKPTKIFNKHFYNFIKTLIDEIFCTVIIKQCIHCIKLIYLRFINFIIKVLRYSSSSGFKTYDKTQTFVQDYKQLSNDLYQRKTFQILNSSIGYVCQMNFQHLQFNAKKISIELLVRNFIDIQELKDKFRQVFSIRKIQHLQLRSLRFFYDAMQFDQFQQPIYLSRNQRNALMHGIEVKRMLEKTFKNIKFHSVTKFFYTDNQDRHEYFRKIKQKILARFCVLVPKYKSH